MSALGFQIVLDNSKTFPDRFSISLIVMIAGPDVVSCAGASFAQRR
jgi:hypothetical protein